MKSLIFLQRYITLIGILSLLIAIGVTAASYLNITHIYYYPISEHFGDNALFNKIIDHLSIFINYFFVSLAALITLFLTTRLFKKGEHIEIKRGATLDNVDNVKRKILKYLKDNNTKYRLTMGQDKLIVGYTEEVRNFLFIGKAGAGKTQAIYSTFLGNVRNIYKKKFIFFGAKQFVKTERLSKGVADFKEPIIAYERKGDDFVGTLYRREKEDDYLFDPRDRDTILWNIFDDLLDEDGEIFEPMVDYYVNSLQPVGDGKDSHFQKQAQAVVKAILLKIAGSKKPSNKALIDYLRENGNLKDLRESLINDPTVNKFGVENFVRNSLTVDDKGMADSQGSSVVATLNDTFKNLSRREFYFEEGNFSIRKWLFSLKDGNRDTRLFIVNSSEVAGAYTRHFSLFISLIYKHGLSLPNNKNRRIWWIMDEIQSLGANGNEALGKYLISEMVNFLAESRSKGFSVTIATQSLPQLEKLIEMEGMRALFQLLSCKSFLQYDEPVGQKFITDFLGENEQEKIKEGISKGGQIGQDKLSENEEEKLKKVVLESELAMLEPLQSYTKIGNFPVCKLTFGYQEPPQICAEPLIRRKIPFFDSVGEKIIKKEKARHEENINKIYEEVQNLLTKSEPKKEEKSVNIEDIFDESELINSAIL